MRIACYASKLSVCKVDFKGKLADWACSEPVKLKQQLRERPAFGVELGGLGLSCLIKLLDD